MKYIVPDYYNRFRCIADKCRHNCCIGWEIDIDQNTCDYYKTVDGDFGKILHDGIDHESCVFRLDSQEKCVFLNQKCLCDIILNLGEDALCQICSDHPRFRNFFADREETGLGLCCEDVCRIILSAERTEFIITEDDAPEIPLTQEEKEILNSKDKIIDILQDRNIPLVRNRNLPEKSFKETVAFYRKMERLDPAWEGYLDAAEKTATYYRLPENIARQLAVYFMFRHQSPGFACHGVGFIEAVTGAMYAAPNFENICEVCRMYSCEVEYSDVNIERLLHCFFNDII